MCQGRDPAESRLARVSQGYLHETGLQTFAEDFHYACADFMQLRVLGPDQLVQSFRNSRDTYTRVDSGECGIKPRQSFTKIRFQA